MSSSYWDASLNLVKFWDKILKESVFSYFKYLSTRVNGLSLPVVQSARLIYKCIALTITSNYNNLISFCIPVKIMVTTALFIFVQIGSHHCLTLPQSIFISFICFFSEPLLVLIEYAPFGDLLGYLRKSRGLNDTYYKDPDIKPKTSLTSQQLVKFAWQCLICHRNAYVMNSVIGLYVLRPVFGLQRNCAYGRKLLSLTVSTMPCGVSRKTTTMEIFKIYVLTLL